MIIIIIIIIITIIIIIIVIINGFTSISNDLKHLPLSTEFFHFSSSTNKQFCVL